MRLFVGSILLFTLMESVALGATLSVRDFGAVGDGKTDDTAAFIRGIAAAIKAGPGTTLFLPAATYRIAPPTFVTGKSAGPAQLYVKRADHLTIQGEAGTKILQGDMIRTLFRVEESRNVTFAHFAIDGDPLPYTQGKITALDTTARTIDLQVDPDYDDIDRPDFAGLKEFRFFDSPFGTDLFKEDQYFPKLVNRERLGAKQWRLTFELPAYKLDPALVGRKWMLWSNKLYRGWSFMIDRSDGTRVDDVHIYLCGSGAFNIYRGGSTTVSHCTIGPPPGSNRLHCGGGGAMSFFNRGVVTVEDCDFSRIDDDGFNLGTHFIHVEARIDPQTCRTEAWPGDFRTGDTVVLWDWKQKTERGVAHVTSAEKEKDGRWLVHFDAPLQFVTLGPGPPPPASGKEFVAQQFDGIDRLVDLDSAGSCILRRNTISSLRARCFLVKTGHSLIEDNVLHDTHMPGILAGPEFFWGEGPELRGLVIRHNTFHNIDAPNISIATFDSATGISNRDVTIEDNTFADYGRVPVIYMRKDPLGAAIHVRNTDGLTIRDNHIEAAPEGAPAVDRIQKEVCHNVNVSP